MAFEIERKFLVTSDNWRDEVYKIIEIKQAYFCNTAKASLRIRVTDQDAFISSKSMSRSITRHEFEYAIPKHDAEFMLENMCEGSAVIKTRRLVKYGAHIWEIDEFHGDNDGLVVAEIELDYEDEAFEKPLWLGQEVSDDIRYLNISLVNHPFKNWTT